MQVGFKSDRGLKRENNEDACFVMPKEGVFVIADGVGGGACGEIASRTAVAMVAEYVRNNPEINITDITTAISYFLPCLEEINEKIIVMSETHPENTGMATTIVICYVGGKRAYFVNMGDSRGYIYRNDRLRQVTEDHSYVNDLVKTGIITVDAAVKHEKKHMITKALGGDLVAEPDFFKANLQEGDIIMLCTDGLYQEVESVEIKKILAQDHTMNQATSELVKKANQNGGGDNITVICIKV
ncbi:MAG: Stp1/IreP family PP2C-type Ser/Thr phosphatase [Anaerovoracaceae bacterium]|nr:Stp1/IreP family PP2C-type Ser/Thr phosphatase [Clostridiales bacterium]